MKQVFIHFLDGLLVLICTIGLHGCGGTETGNPARTPANGGANPQANSAITLMDAICQKLTSCLDVLTESECRLAVSASTTLGKEFGVEDQDYPTYIDVLAGADSRHLHVNNEALDLCLSSIKQLDCDDARIQAVEIEGNTIMNLDQVIPDEGCPEVFSGTAPNN